MTFRRLDHSNDPDDPDSSRDYPLRILRPATAASDGSCLHVENVAEIFKGKRIHILLVYLPMS